MNDIAYRCGSFLGGLAVLFILSSVLFAVTRQSGHMILAGIIGACLVALAGLTLVMLWWRRR